MSPPQQTVSGSIPQAAPQGDGVLVDTAPAPIEVVNAMVAYDGRPVLRSVSFTAPKGKLIGIVGPNGAGKSTLLKAILGLVRLDSGTVRVFGQSLSGVRHRVAYVPQTEAVDWDFPVTAFDVVLMGSYAGLGLLGRPGSKQRRAAQDALDQVGIADYAGRHIRRLSGGQQQRVFLARALCQRADILLLDEPFAGVDAATEQAIFDLIDRLTGAGKTLLVVNHDLSVLDRFDLLMLLNQRIVAIGPTDQVATEENLKLTYGGRLSLLERADVTLRDAGPEMRDD